MVKHRRRKVSNIGGQGLEYWGGGGVGSGGQTFSRLETNQEVPSPKYLGQSSS